MDTNRKIEQIKDVAIYLRKSRGEEDDTQKHQDELEEMCANNNWRYTTFIEIGSSMDIEYRPELQRLLKEIKDDLYDAVAVIDKDRLSRDLSGQALINNVLIENDCLLVTPTKIYDLSNDNDILMSEVEDLMARFEYRMIAKRFRRGKRRGAKSGNWVNGTPPFPYVYNQDTKKLVVDKENLKWYRFIIDKFLEGLPFYEIAWELNRAGIKTQRGGLWHENSIRRIALSEVHLGRIIYNKTSGSGHKNKKTTPLKENNRSEWIVVENCHESIKTLEEHELIIATLSTRRKVPKTSKQIKLPLSGLVKCGKCKKTMQTWRRQRVSGDKYVLKVCQKSDHFGNRCGNSGGDAMIILDAIKDEIRLEIEKMYIEIEKDKKSKYNSQDHYFVKKEMAVKAISQKEDNLKRAYFAYENGVIDIDKYKSRDKQLRQEIEKIRKEIESYDILINKSNNIDKEERIYSLKLLVNKLSSLKDINNDDLNKKLNEHLKDMIYDIYWIREGNDISIEINFI